jgi:DNA-binding CsgD family transcriptional regulator
MTANTFMQLGYFNDARDHLQQVGQISDAHGYIQLGFWSQKGMLEAVSGNESEAFKSLDRAVKAAKDSADPYHLPTVWEDYGLMALMFGRTEVAKSCRERALLAARRNNVSWLVPRLCLDYAELFMWMGDYGSAYGYLMEALSIDAKAPTLDEEIAYVGIPLALLMKDEATLAKCTRLQVVDSAFLSGEPARIGWVAAAFARLYVERGETREARDLLHRAVRAMHGMVMNVWHLPSEVARNGAAADIPRARRLLEARVALPSAQVAEAHLQLFDAFVDQREGRRVSAQMHARNAATRFDGFQWGMYAELARSLLPVAERRPPSSATPHAKPFSEMNASFTVRERQVATVMLKGMTNREIATELSITENTVEKHVASVMNKLGIRSRHQIADALASVER